ncbi:MAG: hypothetical protein RMK29_01685 [Myxococcales bacterium]|nr:cytochrome c [Myxococcota bacterium]MDW8280391.1 hypothetical protein [Myxococcales bacterium]
MLPVEPLALESVSWNATGVAVGIVAAVAEQGDDLVVLSDQGALFFRSGRLDARDGSVRHWRQGAALPLPDEPGHWLVGLDGTGRLRRLRSHAPLEDITDRYRLPAGAVADLVPLGGQRAAFALQQGGLVVWDGGALTRYEGTFPRLGGGHGQVVSVQQDQVQVVDAGRGTGWSYEVPGVVAAVTDPTGKLVVATATSLFVQGGGGHLQRVHQEPSPIIRGLVVAGTGVWMVLDESLALLRFGRLHRAAGRLVPAGAKLVGSPTGDLWVLGPTGLMRYGEPGGGGDFALWKRTILPIYTRTCMQCHQPGSPATVDLSTYGAWASRRMLIAQRVLEGRPSPMPPPGAQMLTQEELDAVRQWVEAGM